MNGGGQEVLEQDPAPFLSNTAPSSDISSSKDDVLLVIQTSKRLR